MSLTRPPETLANVREAAPRRLAEAQRLWRTGAYDGAVYLAGYAAEMTLKLRYFVGQGTVDQPLNVPRQATDPPLKSLVYAVARQTAEGHWRAYHGPAAAAFPLGWRHDLEVWGILTARLNEFGAQDTSELLRHIATLKAGWAVEMRYVRVPVTRDEAQCLLANARWLLDRHCP